MADSSLPHPIISRQRAKAEKLTRYFTAKPCKHGHVNLRATVNGCCIDCAAIKQKANYRDNVEKRRKDARERMRAKKAADPEGVNRYKRERYASNPAKVLAQCTAYRNANREEVNSRQNAAYYANHEKNRRARSAYYFANIEKFRALYLVAYAENPDAYKARAATRRSRKRCAEGSYTKKDVDAMYGLQGKRCANLGCRTSIRRISGSKKPSYHIDHIFPLALGGSNWPENLQLLCPKCNLSKQAIHPLEFARRCGVLF